MPRKYRLNEHESAGRECAATKGRPNAMKKKRKLCSDCETLGRFLTFLQEIELNDEKWCKAQNLFHNDIKPTFCGASFQTVGLALLTAINHFLIQLESDQKGIQPMSTLVQ
jgi:hypothetical protein